MDVAETYVPQEEPLAPDLSHLITEDDEPVDNRYSERQYSLLRSPLFESWDEGKPFEALTDVGLFYRPSNDAVIVPDFLLSLGVEPGPVSEKKEDRSYFVWLYGKPPNLVVEIVSNRVGGELSRKMEIYESIGVSYYAVHDPFRHLGQRELRLFELTGGRFVELADPTKMPEIGLGFTFWEGSYLDVEARWLRFVDRKGRLIPTGLERATLEAGRSEKEKERAEQEKARAEQEKARAEQEKARAEQEKARAEQASRDAEQERKRADEAEARALELERKLREMEGNRKEQK
jgi:Uma2 family endonuclease